MMKNKMALLFLSFFLISYSNGQDCLNLKDGEVLRLDNNGGPLYQSSVQDQDGLKICYANATSIVLKTALPGRPDVSYLHLAFAKGEMQNIKSQKDSAFAIVENKENSLIAENGQICNTIEAIRDERIGGACQRKDVPLEKMLFKQDSSYVQKKILEELSDYYDLIKEEFGINSSLAPSEIQRRKNAFENYKKNFNRLVNTHREKFTQDTCQRAKPNLDNVLKVIKNIVAKKYIENNRISQSHISRMAFISSNGASFYVEVRGNLVKELRDNYLMQLTSNRSSSNALIALKNTLMRFFNNDEMLVNSLITNLNNSDKKHLQDDYDLYVNKDIKGCLNTNPLDYYKSDIGLVKDFEQDSCLKNHTRQALKIKNITNILDNKNLYTIEQLNQFMERLPTLSYEGAMNAIVAPDCSKSNKIKIPSNLSCESNVFQYSLNVSDRANELKYNKNKLNDDVLNWLKNEKISIPVNLCAKIFKQDYVVSRERKDDCYFSRHVVPIIGMTCQRGKISYLIQNSWGDWTPPSHLKMDSYGKAWITEEQMINNSYSYNKIRITK